MVGLGMEGFEGCERCWSETNHCTATTRHASMYVRHARLDAQFESIHRKKANEIGQRICPLLRGPKLNELLHCQAVVGETHQIEQKKSSSYPCARRQSRHGEAAGGLRRIADAGQSLAAGKEGPPYRQSDSRGLREGPTGHTQGSIRYSAVES